MKNTDICPICEEGNLTHIVDNDMAEYKGQQAEIALHYSECDACGSEQANAVDVRNNKRAMQAFKKKVDGLLTGIEIKLIRKKYGLKQSQAATIFGGGPVAFSKYEADDVMQSEPMDNLLRLCRDNLLSFIWLAEKAGQTEVVTALLNKSTMGFSSFNRTVKHNSLSKRKGFNAKSVSTTVDSTNVVKITDYSKAA
jgi:HTH-type transcriptional regulator/antitoxin MqsA